MNAFILEDKKSIIIENSSIPVNGFEVTVRGFDGEIISIPEVVDDSTLKLIFADNLLYDVYFLDVFTGVEHINLKAEFKNVENVAPLVFFTPEFFNNIIYTENDISFIGDGTLLANVSLFVRGYKNIFVYPDYPEFIRKFAFDSNGVIPFIFEEDTYYEFTFVSGTEKIKIPYVPFKPSIFYSSIGEIKRFFTMERLVINEYNDNDLFVLIWKKSLEAHSVAGLPMNMFPDLSAISLFESYVKYSIACDLLFSLLSKVQSSDDKMFGAFDRINLADFSFSVSKSPYENLSTTYMRFSRDKASLDRSLKASVSFKSPASDVKKFTTGPFFNPRKGVI